MEDTQTPQQLQDKFAKFQGLQNQLQMIAVQKQQMAMQTKDIENAQKELKESKGKIYKIAGPILIEAEKETTEKDLTSEKEKLDSNLLVYEKHEKKLSSQLEKLSAELQSIMGKQNVGG